EPGASRRLSAPQARQLTTNGRILVLEARNPGLGSGRSPAYDTMALMAKLLRPVALLLTCGCVTPLRAELVRIDVTQRVDVAGGRPFGLAGPYEKLAGKAHFEVDPENPANRAVTDIARTARNARGRVEFAADLFILRPKDPARSNGTLLLEIP